jgi:hypothetical protein
MNIESLFQTLPKTGNLKRLLESLSISNRLNPPGSKEFDFAVNRNAGRFADLREAVSSLDMVRVKTETPYSWRGFVDLPDRTVGVLHRIKCEILIEGTLPADEAAARRLLTLVLQDKFDFARVFGRVLDAALAERSNVIRGKFVEELRQRPDAVHRDLLFDLRREQPQLGVERVELRPTCYDSAAARDMSDEASGVPFRTKNMLEENRVGYKARLVWSKTDPSHVIARLAYRGAIEGKDVKGPPETRLVDGQVEPLEAWFRQLLSEALGHEELGDVLANDQDMLDRVRLRVSERLGPGTGRVVESLVVHLLQGDAPLRTEWPLQFTENYEIAGVGGAALKALHTVRYALEDRDRWIAAGKEDPKLFIPRDVVNATRLFLNEKQFEDIVRLFLDQRRPADQAEARVSELSQAVVRHVGPIARARGHKIVSTSALLTIPQQGFIDGQEIPPKTDKYALAEPFLEPPIQLTATVKIADDDQNIFAAALARQQDLGKDLKESVGEAIGRAVRSTLLKCSALEYYGSTIVNGLPVRLPSPDDDSDPQTIDVPVAGAPSGNEAGELQERLEKAVDDELKEQFGLKLIRLVLKPGKDDILITRMRDLAELRFDYPAKTFGLLRGEQDFIVKLEAGASIFIRGPSQRHWRSFQFSVSRFAQLNDHIEEIRGMLTKALQVLQNALISRAVKSKTALSGNEALPPEAHQYVTNYFTQQMEEQYGLLVRLPSLELILVRPNVDQSTSMMVKSLLLEIEEKLRRRASTSDEYERENLTKQIQQVRGELATEAAKLEREISQVEAVQVSQDLDSGRLLPGAHSWGTPPDDHANQT